MISQILAAILIAAVVVLLTWVYQRFHGQFPATPNPTPVSPTGSIQASQTGNPDPNIDHEALSEETQDEAGPDLTEDTTRSAATLKTDEEQQQQADSQTPTAISTHGSLEMDAVRLPPMPRGVAESDPNQHIQSARGELQEEESLPLAASGDFALPRIRRENSQASQLLGSRNQDSTRSATGTAPKQYLGQNPSQQEDDTTPTHYLRHYPNMQVEETTPKKYLSQRPSQHMIELKDPAYVDEEGSHTASSTMSPDPVPSELHVIYERGQSSESTYQEIAVKRNLKYAAGESLQGESLATSAVSALPAIPRENVQGRELYMNQDTICSDTETTLKQYQGQNTNQQSFELNETANMAQEASQTESSMLEQAVFGDPEMAHEQGQSSYITAERDELQEEEILAFPAQPQQTGTEAHTHSERGREVAERVQHLPVPIHQTFPLRPTQGFKFYKMLVNLSNMITSDDLEILKFRLEYDLKKKLIEQITRPIDLFRKMKERCFIDENNLIYLQEILQDVKTGKQELLKIVTAYCEKTRNVLHFRPAESNPVIGFRYVRFHLYLDKEYTRDELTELQQTVAEILDVDIRLLFVVGVEPSHSLLVTIMLPEMYVDILVTNLDQNLLHDRFADLSIDTITIDENVYEIEVYHKPLARRSNEQLLSLYHQLSNRDLQIDGLEITCDQLQQKIQQLEAVEEAKTAEMADKKHEQLMAKVEMLENKVDSKAALIEESEQKCGQLEQKVEQLEQQKIQQLEAVEKAKTAELAESEEKRKQLMAKIEMLENKVDSKAALIEESEQKCKQLEQKIEQLEQQKIQQLEAVEKAKTAELAESEEKRKQLMAKIEMLENKVDSKAALIEESEQKCKQLEQKVEQLEQQKIQQLAAVGEAKTAQLAESEEKRKQLMAKVEMLENKVLLAESGPDQHLHSARGELQEEKSLTLADSGNLALPQNQSQLFANHDTISLDAEATANQYLGQYPSQHKAELKDPADAGEEVSQIYGNQGSIIPDKEPTARQHLGPGQEGRVSLPTQRSRVRLQEPPPSWSFDDLLTDLNRMITTDELEILKDKVESLLRKKAIGEIKSPRDLFRQMKQREFLNANDIIYLQAILMKLGRRDLIERTMDYCLQAENVLHFHPATGTTGAVPSEPVAALAASAGPALSTIPRDKSPARQLYRQQGSISPDTEATANQYLELNELKDPADAEEEVSQTYGNQGSISPDTEPTARQDLLPGQEGRVSLPTQQSRSCLQEPPPNWRFDDLLTDLNRMITTDELDILKDKFQNCLRKKAIGEIKSPTDLFRKMKHREFLNANDIIYLQAILMKLGRRDLIERTMDYCLQAENVLHFHPATGTTEKGYKYVQVHLYLDKDYSTDDLTSLQCRLANILCCPREFITCLLSHQRD